MKTYLKVLVCLLLVFGLMIYMGFIGPWLVNQKSTMTLFMAPLGVFLYAGICVKVTTKMFGKSSEE